VKKGMIRKGQRGNGKKRESLTGEEGGFTNKKKSAGLK